MAEDNSFFSVMREAFVGTNRDFTKGSIPAALIILAIPMILEMSMESLFAIVDTFFVSKLGAESIAVVGLTESVLALIYAVGVGLYLEILEGHLVAPSGPQPISGAAVELEFVGWVSEA